jgi:leukotriene-A4 hydrolase
MNDYGLDNAFSSIHPVLKGRNPDSSFSTVPYEKGFQFLNYLETLIGDAAFQQFLQFYISQHSLTSISALDFRGTWEYFVERKLGLLPEEINGILAQVDFERWINVGELAPVPADFTTTASQESEALALEYISLGGASSPANFADYLGWYSNLQVVFHITLANNFD